MPEVRDHKATRINRARLELELRRAIKPAIITMILLAIAAAVAAYLVGRVAPTLLSSTHTVRFAVADASSVVPSADEVRFEGIPAGTITGVDMHGIQPVITAQVKSKYGPIYRNARAILRPNTPLRDMYLDIVDPGTRQAGVVDPDHPLPATQTRTSVSIDQVLDVFRSNTRVQLRTLLNNLGNGLRDRGASLREAFVELMPSLQTVGNITQQLARRAPLVRRLVHNTAVLTDDLGHRQRELRTLLRKGGSTLDALHQGAGDLDRTLAELPPTLSQLDSSFTAVRGVLGAVDGAVRSLYPVADRLPRSLSALRTLGARATPAVRALQTPVRRLVPFVGAVVPLSANLRTTVDALLPQVKGINHTTHALAICPSGVQNFFRWNPSLAKYGDARGFGPRGNVAVGLQSTGILSNGFEFAPQSCTPGKAIGGRLPAPQDEH
jgi:virulence factor Mce-like protein